MQNMIEKHPWMIGSGAPTNDLSQVTEKLREFNARRKLKVNKNTNN